MTLMPALCIATFGHDATHPKRAASIRCLLLVCASSLCSIGLHQTAIHTSLMPWPRASLLMFPLACLVQWVIFLTLCGSTAIMQPDTTIARLLTTLPISKQRNYWASVFPQLCLVILTAVAMSWAVLAWAQQLGVTFFAGSCSMAMGIASAWGYFFTLRRYKLILRTPLLAGLVGAELLLVRSIHNLAHDPAWWALVLLSMLLAMGCLLVGKTPPLYTQASKVSAAGQWLPASWWFVKKIVRSPITRSSLGFGLILSLLCVTVFHALNVKTPAITFLVAGCIVASCAVDIRSISVPYRPAEITALKGVLFFVRHYCKSSLITLCAVCPLLIYTLPLPAITSFLGLSQVFLGVCVGLCTGSVFVPQARDISGQFTATLTSITLLSTPLFTASLQTLPAVPLSMLHVLAASAAIVTLGVIEYLRNPFIWRPHVQ